MPEMLSRLISPLPGPCPCGVDINHDPDFDVIKTEISKQGDIDFTRAQNLAERIVTEKSKDIRIILFLAYVHLRRGNWKETGEILTGLAVLAERCYDDLFPRRTRARELAFRWLSESKITDILRSKTLELDHLPHLQRIKTSLERLRRILHTVFPGNTPFPQEFLSSITSEIERLTPAVHIEMPLLRLQEKGKQGE